MLHEPQLGVSAALGALSTGFASQQGVYRTRAAAMLATAAGMSLSMLVGGYAAHSTIGIVVAAALWGYACGIVSSLGAAATAVGLNSVIALVIADAFSGSSISGVPLQAVLVLAGGLEQTLLLVVLWPARRYSSERHVLGDAYRALGRFAAEMCGATVQAPHPAVIADVRETLADRAPFARRGDIAAFQALADEAERVRAALGALVTDRYRYDRRNESARVALLCGVGASAAPVLEEIANALHEARAPRVSGEEWQSVDRAAAALDALPGTIGKHARSQAHALAGQLRTAARVASAPASDVASLPPARRYFAVAPIAQGAVALRSSLSLRSPYGRHAIRLAVALAATMLLARLGPFHRGYWIPMTAALVLRPDFRTTFTRGIARIAGTLFGAVVATLIVAWLPQSTNLDVALATLFAAVGYFAFNLNYAVYSATVTAYVVFLLALSGVTGRDAVVERSIATLAGAGVAAVVYLAWPTWESHRVRKALAAQLSAYRAYASAILNAYVDPARFDRRRVRELQRAAWQARTGAEASVDTMLAEPHRTHAIAPRIALGILAAMQRVGVALLALNGYLDAAQRIPRPALGELVAGIDAAFARCIADLERASGERMPPLRDLYLEADRRFSSAPDADAEVVLAECDLIVDGLNTVEALLSSESAR